MKNSSTESPLKDLLSAPVNVVTLTTDRIQEAFNEAVRQGRITSDDAQELAQNLIQRGRSQTEDLVSQIEDLLNRGKERVGLVKTKARDGAAKVLLTSDKPAQTGNSPLVQIDGYDAMTAAKAIDAVNGLSPADLRAVRAFEKQHANRKTVLDAIERQLTASK